MKAGRSSDCKEDAGNYRLVMNQGVMVVSIAYRLGPFGFLWAPESESPEKYPYSGNWGLIDQTQAMKWAQKWAPHFTGDTSRATLNGCSAGSESVWWHLTTPASWPYFHRAITVGVGLNAQTTAERATQKWNQFLAETGCDGFECLRGLTAAELRNSRNAYGVKAPIKLILTSSYYTPVVDGVSLLDQLVNLVADGRIRPNTPISFNYAEHDAFS